MSTNTTNFKYFEVVEPEVLLDIIKMAWPDFIYWESEIMEHPSEDSQSLNCKVISVYEDCTDFIKHQIADTLEDAVCTFIISDVSLILSHKKQDEMSYLLIQVLKRSLGYLSDVSVY